MSCFVFAYAGDATVFITGQDGILNPGESLELEKALSAMVNWAKTEGLIVGQWSEVFGPDFSLTGHFINPALRNMLEHVSPAVDSPTSVSVPHSRLRSLFRCAC